MNRKVIFILVGALAAVLLIVGLWYFFFARERAPEAGAPGGFGSAEDRPSADSAGDGRTNVPSALPGQTTIRPQNEAAPTGGYIGSTLPPPQTAGPPPPLSVPGGAWLGGPGGTGGPLSTFTPSQINQLNNGSVGGTVYVFGTGGGTPPPGSGGLGLGTALLGAGIAGAVSCTGFLAGGGAGIASTASIFAVQVNVPTKNTQDVMDCFARVIAKVVLQQMTASIVNWINGGFNGKPAFVQNFNTFLTGVADRAAGEFIRGSGLSFLCSPFQNQIRVALAQSYARRNSAPSCTLSGIIKNFSSFTNGNFSAGGWGGLLSFTGTPTNNPFGAYMYAQSGLAAAQAGAVASANRTISPGGFQSVMVATQCKDPYQNGQVIGGCPIDCTCKITTPGSVSEAALAKQLGVSQDYLLLAKSFDEIINALITQLMRRALGGLSELSGPTGYGGDYLTPDQRAAQEQGQTLLTELQAMVTLAQQYGGTKQGSIADIENVQRQIQTLVNCWETASSSPGLSDAQRAQAGQNAAAAAGRLLALQPQVDAYNNEITRANRSIGILQELQTKTLQITSTADVTAIKNAFAEAQAAGLIITQNDVTAAQQDRNTLQTQMDLLSEQTSAELTQCHAFN